MSRSQIRQRTLQLGYRFDRLLSDKLAHAYQLLVPDKRQPIGGAAPKQTSPGSRHRLNWPRFNRLTRKYVPPLPGSASVSGGALLCVTTLGRSRTR